MSHPLQWRQPPFTAHQLHTARLRAAWEYLSDVGAAADLLSAPVHRSWRRAQSWPAS